MRFPRYDQIQIRFGPNLSGSNTTLSPPYNLLLPWPNLSLSSTPQSTTTTQCRLLPTPPSTLPRTPVPSLAPPSHGALAPSVTAIVTSPVHPPVNSQSASYTFTLHLSLSLTPLLFLSPADLRDTGKISSSMESDRGSIMNALSAMEREDELVSLFTPPFRFLVAKRSIAVPHSAAITLVAVSTSRISML
jgi:hypothetical protein